MIFFSSESVQDMNEWALTLDGILANNFNRRVLDPNRKVSYLPLSFSFFFLLVEWWHVCMVLDGPFISLIFFFFFFFLIHASL